MDDDIPHLDQFRDEFSRIITDITTNVTTNVTSQLSAVISNEVECQIQSQAGALFGLLLAELRHQRGALMMNTTTMATMTTTTTRPNSLGPPFLGFSVAQDGGYMVDLTRTIAAPTTAAADGNLVLSPPRQARDQVVTSSSSPRDASKGQPVPESHESQPKRQKKKKKQQQQPHQSVIIKEEISEPTSSRTSPPTETPGNASVQQPRPTKSRSIQPHLPRDPPPPPPQPAATQPQIPLPQQAQSSASVAIKTEPPETSALRLPARRTSHHHSIDEVITIFDDDEDEDECDCPDCVADELLGTEEVPPKTNDIDLEQFIPPQEEAPDGQAKQQPNQAAATASEDILILDGPKSPARPRAQSLFDELCNLPPPKVPESPKARAMRNVLRKKGDQGTKLYRNLRRNCLVPDCPAQFHTKQQLNDHLRIKHYIQQFRCLHGICGESFVSKQEFSQHQYVAHSNEPCICSICGSHLKDRQVLYQHTYHQHYQGLFGCTHPNCPFTDTTRQSLINHHFTAHELIPCPHPGCGKTFKKTSSLNIHRRSVHQQEKPFRCKWPQCDHPGTPDRFSLIRHIRVVHFGLPPTTREQQALNIVDHRDPAEWLQIIEELL